ncbi:hypothetical protein [Streptomyces mayteni]
MSTQDANSPAQRPLLDVAPETFAEEVRALVRETAPSRFAVVCEFESDGVPNAAVAAWGLADPQGDVLAVGAGGGRRVAFVGSAERAAALWGRFTGESTRVEWVDPVPKVEE